MVCGQLVLGHFLDRLPGWCVAKSVYKPEGGGAIWAITLFNEGKKDFPIGCNWKKGIEW